MGQKDKRSKNVIWFALIVNIIILLAALFLFKPFFEENDDAFLSMIAEGAYGSREIHLIYSNVILGYVYRALYTVYPAIRWHSILQYVFVFTAYTAFTCVIQLMSMRRDRLKVGRVLSVLFLIAVSYESYVSLQYSKTATITAAVGYLILLYALRVRDTEEDAKISRKGLNILDAIAYLLIFYAMLLRDSSFMLASLLLIPLVLYEFIKSFKSGKGRALWRYIYTFIPLVIFLTVFTVVNKQAYNVDPSWKSFMNYNDTRMQLLDYRYDLLDYSRYSARLKEMDISRNDALLYLTWQFGDDTVLTTDKMQEVLNGAPARWTAVDCLKALLAHIYEDVLVFDPLIMSFMLIVIYLLLSFFKDRDGGGVLLLIFGLIEFSAVLVYYEYCGRWSHRIVFAAILALMLQMVYLSAVKVDAGSVNISVAAAFIAIACLTALMGNRLDHNKYVRSGTDYRLMLDSLKEDKDTLYVADTFTFQEAYKYDVFRPYEPAALDNFVAVGSWFVNSPVTKGITERFGFKNPFDALAGKPAMGKQVVLIDNMYLEEKIEFINEHYGTAEAAGFTDKHGFRCSNIKN